MADSINRRDFLATSTAAATVATLAPAKAAGKLAPLSARDFYYIHNGGHNLAPSEITGCPNDVWLKVGGKRNTLRRRIAPLDTPQRFVVVTLSWEHTTTDLPESYFELEGEAERAAGDAAYAPFLCELPHPESYAALPPGLVQETSHDLDECPYQTREEAFADAADSNRKTWDGIAIGEEFEHMDWCVVVEICVADAKPANLRFEFSQSGVGVIEGTAIVPVRIVIPTAAELAHYAIAKGGEA